jgi:hypothetical protein
VGTLNHGRHTWVSDRPQRRHRLYGGERQVIAGDCLRSRPGVFSDLPGQLPGIKRLAAMLGDKELPGDLGAHLCPAAAGTGQSPGKPAASLIQRSVSRLHAGMG